MGCLSDDRCCSDIPLENGINGILVFASDAAGNAGQTALTVEYNP